VLHELADDGGLQSDTIGRRLTASVKSTFEGQSEQSFHHTLSC
jgi:hypothetical protein